MILSTATRNIKDTDGKIFCEPMLSIERRPFDAPTLDTVKCLAFTSAHTPQIFWPIGASLPVYTVGDCTKEAAIEAGYRVVKTTQCAQELIKILPDCALHVRGEDIAFKVCENSLIVYKAQFVESLSDKLIAHLTNAEINTALFFSARAAQNFSRLARQYNLVKYLKNIRALCLSPRVLDSINKVDWADVSVPKRPRTIDLLDMIERK